jgi:hypothetical protein
MSDTGTQKRVQAIRITMLMLVVLLGLVDVSSALEVDFGLDIMAVSSDNVFRAPVGLERDGYLLSIDGDFLVSGDLGSGSFDLSIGGGREIQYTGGSTDSDNYDIRLVTRVPWSGTGYVEGTAGTSEGTAEPDLMDISQVRVRTKESLMKFEVGRQTAPKSKWRTALIRQTEERFDHDFTEFKAELGWNTGLDQRRSLAIDMVLNSGTEDFDENEWTGSSASVDFRKKGSSTFTGGYRLAWEEQNLELADGTMDRSEKLTALIHYEIQTFSGWTFSSDLGMDSLKPPIGERQDEANAILALASAKDKKIRMSSTLATSTVIQDPVENEVAWTRNSHVSSGILWNFSRKFSVEPSVYFILAELFGNGIADRKDATRILRLDTRWLPSRNWTVELNAHSEARDSSENIFDPFENKLELRVTGALL